MYEYNAKVIRVVDGDTIDMEVDLGFKVFARLRIQMADVDAPEPRQEGGKESKEYLSGILEPGTTVVLHPRSQDRWGRWVSDITATNTTGSGSTYSVGNQMVSAGHAEHLED